jgi:hypothetical protein
MNKNHAILVVVKKKKAVKLFIYVQGSGKPPTAQT